MKAKYIPNILSILRLCMSAAFAAVFIWGPMDEIWILGPLKYYIAVAIFIIAGVTDVIDGILARKNNWITDAGKILDPLADKLMQITALVCVVVFGLVPWWVIIPIALKEIIMGIGSIVFFKIAGEIGTSMNYGKAYTVLFYVVIAAIIVFQIPVVPAAILCTFTGVVGLTAIVLYYFSYLKGKLGKKNRKAEN